MTPSGEFNFINLIVLKAMFRGSAVAPTPPSRLRHRYAECKSTQDPQVSAARLAEVEHWRHEVNRLRGLVEQEQRRSAEAADLILALSVLVWGPFM